MTPPHQKKPLSAQVLDVALSRHNWTPAEHKQLVAKRRAEAKQRQANGEAVTKQLRAQGATVTPDDLRALLKGL